MSSILKRLEKLELETKSFGFYWENSTQILQQIQSECQEIEAHFSPETADKQKSTLAEEIGDLLHATFSLSVFCQFDTEQILTAAVDKFESRFKSVQKIAKEQGLNNLHGLPFEYLMDLWTIAKTQEAPKKTSLPNINFLLDSKLRESCFILADWPLCQILLKNNAEYPWFILVPRRENVSDLTMLSQDEQTQLMLEINELSRIIQRFFQPDKLNMGSLGNIVPQFHYHVIARFKNDPLWPEGVWQKALKESPYVNPKPLIEQLQTALKQSTAFTCVYK